VVGLETGERSRVRGQVLHIDINIEFVSERMEYKGALYHMIAGGKEGRR